MFCLFAPPHTNHAFGIVPYYYSIDELLKGEGERGGWKSYHTSLGCLYHTFIFEEEDGEIPIHSLHLCYCGSVHVLSLKVSIKVSIVCEENWINKKNIVYVDPTRGRIDTLIAKWRNRRIISRNIIGISRWEMALVLVCLAHTCQVSWSVTPFVGGQSCKAMAMAHGNSYDEPLLNMILTLKPLECPSLPPLMLHCHALRQSKFLDIQASEWLDDKLRFVHSIA